MMESAKLGFANPGLFMKIRVLGFKEAKKVFLHGVLARVKASECGPQCPSEWVKSAVLSK